MPWILLTVLLSILPLLCSWWGGYLVSNYAIIEFFSYCNCFRLTFLTLLFRLLVPRLILVVLFWLLAQSLTTPMFVCFLFRLSYRLLFVQWRKSFLMNLSSQSVVLMELPVCGSHWAALCQSDINSFRYYRGHYEVHIHWSHFSKILYFWTFFDKFCETVLPFFFTNTGTNNIFVCWTWIWIKCMRGFQRLISITLLIILQAATILASNKYVYYFNTTSAIVLDKTTKAVQSSVGLVWWNFNSCDTRDFFFLHLSFQPVVYSLLAPEVKMLDPATDLFTYSDNADKHVSHTQSREDLVELSLFGGCCNCLG